MFHTTQNLFRFSNRTNIRHLLVVLLNVNIITGRKPPVNIPDIYTPPFLTSWINTPRSVHIYVQPIINNTSRSRLSIRAWTSPPQNSVLLSALQRRYRSPYLPRIRCFNLHTHACLFFFYFCSPTPVYIYCALSPRLVLGIPVPVYCIIRACCARETHRCSNFRRGKKKSCIVCILNLNPVCVYGVDLSLMALSSRSYAIREVKNIRYNLESSLLKKKTLISIHSIMYIITHSRAEQTELYFVSSRAHSFEIFRRL